jgi:Mg2+ and Co2+ transporter CorA
MELVDTPEAVRALDGAPACALAASLEDPLAHGAADAWGLAPPRRREPPRRPSVRQLDDQLEVVLLMPGADHRQLPVQIVAGHAGLLVIAEDEALAALRAVPGESDGVMEALTGMLLAAARRCEEVLDRLEDESERVEDGAGGFSSSPQRRTLGRLRADLFRIQETQAAMHRLCTPDEELAQELPKGLHRRLRRAATVFDANRSAAARLYAMLGDVLAEQGAVVDERLTLVATIFLPLTLATGFFGMNFAWLQDRTGSLAAFVLLGVVVPTLATVLSLVLVRALTRSS